MAVKQLETADKFVDFDEPCLSVTKLSSRVSATLKERVQSLLNIGQGFVFIANALFQPGELVVKFLLHRPFFVQVGLKILDHLVQQFDLARFLLTSAGNFPGRNQGTIISAGQQKFECGILGCRRRILPGQERRAAALDFNFCDDAKAGQVTEAELSRYENPQHGI